VRAVRGYNPPGGAIRGVVDNSPFRLISSL